MSDYSNTYGGAAKDAANSVILGADIDTQLDNVATNSATKTDKIGAPVDGVAVAMDSTGNIKKAGDIFLEEAADHTSTSGPGKGILWVKNTVPARLVFTNDAGDDLEIAAGVLTEQFVVKAADESVANNTLQDDNDLQVTLAANGIYEMEFLLSTTNASTLGDFQYEWAEPDGTWQSEVRHANRQSPVGQEATYEAGAPIVRSIDAGERVHHRGSIQVEAGGTGGIFKLRWAQSATDAGNPTFLRKGSWLRARRIL